MAAITDDELADLAREPKRIRGDQAEVENRDIKDVLLSRAATAITDEGSAWGGALRMARVVPPGAVSP